MAAFSPKTFITKGSHDIDHIEAIFSLYNRLTRRHVK